MLSCCVLCSGNNTRIVLGLPVTTTKLTIANVHKNKTYPSKFEQTNSLCNISVILRALWIVFLPLPPSLLHAMCRGNSNWTLQNLTLWKDTFVDVVMKYQEEIKNSPHVLEPLFGRNCVRYYGRRTKTLLPYLFIECHKKALKVLQQSGVLKQWNDKCVRNRKCTEPNLSLTDTCSSLPRSNSIRLHRIVIQCIDCLATGP